MHKEYAVDPNTIASDWQTFRRLTEYFGFHQGRVVARFPRKWERRVKEAFAHFEPVNKLAAVERLSKLERYGLVAACRSCEDAESWLRSAWQAHQDQPFTALISNSGEVRSDSVLTSEQCDLEHPLMQVSRNADIRRGPNELARAARVLLQNSLRIKFVDPYFNPQGEKWQKTLREFLSISVQGGRNSVEFEYHYCEKEDTGQPSRDDCRQRSGAWLRAVLPPAASIVFFRWKERLRGERFHARYILTEKGGLQFDAGLDAGREGETTLVSLIDPASVMLALKKFEPAGTVYELVKPILRVDSPGEVTEVII